MICNRLDYQGHQRVPAHDRVQRAEESEPRRVIPSRPEGDEKLSSTDRLEVPTSAALERGDRLGPQRALHPRPGRGAEAGWLAPDPLPANPGLQNRRHHEHLRSVPCHGREIGPVLTEKPEIMGMRVSNNLRPKVEFIVNC